MAERFSRPIHSSAGHPMIVGRLYPARQHLILKTGRDLAFSFDQLREKDVLRLERELRGCRQRRSTTRSRSSHVTA
jgi:hypothetical protein